MRILYDGKIYSMQAAGGINRYFANLIGRLPASFSPSLLVGQSRDFNYPVHPQLKIHGQQRFDLGRFSSRLNNCYSAVKGRYLQRIVNANQFDVVHPTYYDLLTRQAMSAYRFPIVLTVHDMIHELFRDSMDPKEIAATLKKRAIDAAQAIICVSQNTRKDLLEHYGVPEAKVTVIYHGCSVDSSLSYGPEQVPSRPFYLHVGSRFSYKNFDVLVKAFASVVSVQPDLALCVVGAPFTKAEQQLITSLRLADHIEHYGYVSDAHLAKLYRCSISLVYPSLYEGFGMPLLEAMACGTAVIASNVSSIPEVIGEAGLLFDPASSDELVDSLLFLLNNSSERELLVAKGRERSQDFSWDTTVTRTLEVYRAVQ
jgi:glycosyltransferase involved in cell wall biosynthesis